MKKMGLFISSICLPVLLVPACIPQKENLEQRAAEAGFPELTGPYFGQQPPGDAPELFAPGLICTGMGERDVAMTPQGDEIFFGRFIGAYAVCTIMHTRLVGGRWTEPEAAPFAADPRYFNLEPAMAPDGGRLLFLSSKPAEEGGEPNQDIWVVERQVSGWGEPYRLEAPVNSEAAEYFPSLTRGGTIYFTRQDRGQPNFIYRSRLVEGRYSEPERLPEQVNCGANRFNAFIDPDERFIIVCAVGRSDSLGASDYYIVFRNAEDGWSEPVNLGDKVNTAGGVEFSPYVSPDGKYFFFMSSRLGVDVENFKMTAATLRELGEGPGNGNPDIYWMKADFLEALRPEGF